MKALALSVKTMTDPAATPGRLSGSTTRRNVRTGPAPRLAAARSTAGSMRPRAVATESTMNDRKTWTRPSAMAVSVYKRRSDSSISPRPRSAELTSPFGPRITSHPKLRTTTLISRGARMTRVRYARRRPVARLR